MKTNYNPTYHRDGTVTYWSVYRQQWIRRARFIPADELAAQGSDRTKIIRNLARLECDHARADYVEGK